MEAQIKLDFNNIQAPLIGVIKEANDNIVFGLRLINDLEKLPEQRIEQQSLDFQNSGIRFEFGKPINDLPEQKRVFKSWLIRKGFEDLVKAINLSSIEAYYLFELFKLKGKTVEIEILEKEIKKIKKDALSQSNFPDLIENRLNIKTMTYYEPVKSINKVRNCLIHRNGIVTKEKDINDKENSVLRLKYYSLEFVRIDENDKETSRLENTGIGIMAKPNEKIFQVGDKIDFTEKEFRGCLYTCQVFGIELTEIIKNNCM